MEYFLLGVALCMIFNEEIDMLGVWLMHRLEKVLFGL